ncbi:hypothetical protein MNBD_GAMMA26-1932, partial [hydrothermal vent metagenome]
KPKLSGSVHIKGCNLIGGLDQKERIEDVLKNSTEKQGMLERLISNFYMDTTL